MVGGRRAPPRREGRQGARRARVPHHAQGPGPRARCCAPALWTGAAALTGLFLHIYDDWPLERVAELTALAAVHSYIVSCIRAVWWAQILGEMRGRLFAVGSPLKQFDDSHFRRFLLVAMIVAGGVLAAQAAFAYYFVPITPRAVPPARDVLPGRDARRPRRVDAVRARDDRAISAATSRRRAASTQRDAPPAAVIYRRAQALPYRLALLTIARVVRDLASSAR